MYIVFFDFDQTFKNPNIISEKDINFFNSFLKDNKAVILSEASITELINYTKSYHFNMDLFSISNQILYEDGIYNYELIDEKIISEIETKFNDDIYTAYGEGINTTYIFKYQERLKPIYPPERINSKSLTSINVVIYNQKYDEFRDYLDKHNLSYVVVAKDLKKAILRIQKTNFTKDKIVELYKIKYPNNIYVGISDSINDLKFIEKCDIKIAMKNADDELKKHVDIITNYNYNESGAIKILDNISKFKKV